MTISIVLLSILLALFSILDICFRIQCVEISAVFGTIFLILTVALTAVSYYFPIKYALKSNKKRYLLYMLITIIIFAVQIMFKNQIIEIWNSVFMTYYSPNLPGLN